MTYIENLLSYANDYYFKMFFLGIKSDKIEPGAPPEYFGFSYEIPDRKDVDLYAHYLYFNSYVRRQIHANYLTNKNPMFEC